MGNNILRFKKATEEAEVMEAEYAKALAEQDWMTLNYLYTTTFHLCSLPTRGMIINPQYLQLITLDEEDLEYFKKKYFPKLDIEMENKVAEIKAQYGK